MRNVIAGVAALMLAGCAHGDRVPRGGETITYATGRCFGTCPVYSVTLGPDGQGIFDGQQFTAARGEHRFQATPDQVRAFADTLARVRPEGERSIVPGARDCGTAPTDMPSVSVRWQGAGGASSLSFYYGCAASNRAIADALRAAPATLPIAEWIGKP